MAINFAISVGRKSKAFHLQLNGSFDGSAAYELLHLLQKLARNKNRIYIHTDRLTHIYPFGSSIFQRNLHLLAGQGVSLIFSGENAREIFPVHSRNLERIDLSMA